MPSSPVGEVMVRADVASVDLPAHSFTLVGAPSGYSVVTVTDATRFTLAEGDPALFSDVEADTRVSVTGRPDGAGRLVARLVVIIAL